MDSPFGGIGWSNVRPDSPTEHDTVYCGAFVADVFRRLGGFDESLGSNEDDEFNARLRASGGRVVMDPRIRLWYTPRDSPMAVFSQYYRYGRWKPAVMRRHRSILGFRSVVPSVFVISLLALGIAAIWSNPARVLFASELLAYGVAACVAGTLSLRGRRETLWLLPRVLLTFPAFHVGYGLGMLRGLATRPRPRTAIPVVVHDRHA
jgi:hypothetical protein